MPPGVGAASAGVRVRTGCRVDLAGGTLDIWPLGLLHPGARTLNVAVDLPVAVELRSAAARYRVRQGGELIEAGSAEELAQHPEALLVAAVASALELPPFEASLESASPRGGGLGASSSLIVALVTAAEELFDRTPSSAVQRAALGRDLEARMMGLPTGAQDHFPALLGGALEIVHRPGGEDVRQVPADLDALAASLVVAYSGQGHFSAAQNWEVVRRRLEGDRGTVERFEGIAHAAERAAEALRAGDLAELGRWMGREWSFRRRLADGVSTVAVEGLLEAAGRAGAWGGKVCGAGGGGSIAVLCPPRRRPEVAAALEAEGAQVLSAPPRGRGLEIEALRGAGA